MAATLNLFLQAKIVLNGQEFVIPSRGLYAPYTFSTSADILLHEQVSVSSATVTELIAVGSGSDIASASMFLIIPGAAGNLVWATSASDADNSGIATRANFPVLIPTGNSLPYQNTTANRADETAAAIATIKAYQASGSAAVYHVLALA